MLVNYTDAEETSLTKSAIEIRKRVSGRKLEEKLKKEEITQDDLNYIKDQNSKEIAELTRLNYDVIAFDSKEKETFHNKNQQFLATKKLKNLELDIQRITTLNKSRYNSLLDLETRIKNMRMNLNISSSISSTMNVSNTSVENQIISQLRNNVTSLNSVIDSEHFKVCRCCNKKIIKNIIKFHEDFCFKDNFYNKNNDENLKNSSSSNIRNNIGLITSANSSFSSTTFSIPPSSNSKSKSDILPYNNPAATNNIKNFEEVFSIDASMITSMTTFKPNPPRECKLKNVTVSTIEFSWLPPIFDGGLNITNYEIKFKGKIQKYDKKLKKNVPKNITISSYLTTNWIYKENPIAHTGYKLVDLVASSEYYDFCVRCCNIRGWSDWVELYPKNTLIKTKECLPPTPPLDFTCFKITSSCAYFRWSPPFYNGGLSIIRYIIGYTVIELVDTVTEKDKEVIKKKEYVIHSNKTSAVVRHLPENSTITKIYLIAINSGEKKSEKTYLNETLRTLDCSYYRKIKRELEYAEGGANNLENISALIEKNSSPTNKDKPFSLDKALENELDESNLFVDTKFFTGVTQRVNRLDHIRKLKEELLITPINEEELEEENEWNLIQLKIKLKEEKKEKKLKEKERKKLQFFQQNNPTSSSSTDVITTTNTNITSSPLGNSKTTGGSSANNLANQLVTPPVILNSTSLSISDNTNKNNSLNFEFTIEQRRNHYKKKLFNITTRLNEINKEIKEIDMKRFNYASITKGKEEILLKITLEKERLKNYNSKIITSSLLTNTDIQYKTNDLRIKIENYYNKILKDIGEIKFLIISNENKKKSLKEEYKSLLKLKYEKLALFNEFSTKINKKLTFFYHYNQNIVRKMKIAQKKMKKNQRFSSQLQLVKKKKDYDDENLSDSNSDNEELNEESGDGSEDETDEDLLDPSDYFNYKNDEEIKSLEEEFKEQYLVMYKKTLNLKENDDNITDSQNIFNIYESDDKKMNKFKLLLKYFLNFKSYCKENKKLKFFLSKILYKKFYRLKKIYFYKLFHLNNQKLLEKIYSLNNFFYIHDTSATLTTTPNLSKLPPSSASTAASAVVLISEKTKDPSLSLVTYKKSSQDESSTPMISASNTAALLQSVFRGRTELEKNISEIIKDTKIIQQNLNLTKLTKNNMNKLISSHYYSVMSEGMNHNLLYHNGMKLLYEADSFRVNKNYKRSLELYQEQIKWIHANSHLFDEESKKSESKEESLVLFSKIKYLSICYGRLGQLFHEIHEYNRSIIEYDRQVSLAREIQDKIEESEGLFGIGIGYYELFDYENALSYLLLVENDFLNLNRLNYYQITLEYIIKIYKKLNFMNKNDENIANYEEKLKGLTNSYEKLTTKMIIQLDEMKERLLTNQVCNELCVEIERTTLKSLQLKKKLLYFSHLIDFLNDKIDDSLDEMEKTNQLIVRITEELNAAIETDDLERGSSLIDYGKYQVYDIEELKKLLKVRKEEEINSISEIIKKKKSIEVLIKNTESNIQEYQELLQIEDGELMKYTRKGKPFRYVSLSASNVAGNEVTGTATGGFEEFVAAEGGNLYIIDYHSGELRHIFSTNNNNIEVNNENFDLDKLLSGSDEAAALKVQEEALKKFQKKDRSSAENSSDDEEEEVDHSLTTCHSGTITCLLHAGSEIFSGSTDQSIICWDLVDRSFVYKLVGHNGSVVSLACDNHHVISGSSDNTMRLWSRSSRKLIRVLYGHSKSVISMEIGLDWILSGSVDCEARMWKISISDIQDNEKKSKNSTSISNSRKHYSIETSLLFRGHESPVTCVKYGAIEVVTGDNLGNIFIWWLKTGEILRKIKVHDGPVRSLQFDSIHIVSGGLDKNVAIVDIATGEILQTLRGHTESILAIAFDNERIISIGQDNTIRYWRWSTSSDNANVESRDKYHVLNEKETLYSIAKNYSISLDNLMKWNGIKNAKDINIGMKLLVKKGNPNELTKHELEAAKKSQKHIKNSSYILKKLKNTNGLDKILLDNDEEDVNNLSISLLNKKLNQSINKYAQSLQGYDQSTLTNRLFYQDKREVDLFSRDNNTKMEKNSLISRLISKKNEDNSKDFNMKYEKYYFTKENKEEWIEIAKEYMELFLNNYIEMEIYDILLKELSPTSMKNSLVGRISQKIIEENPEEKEKKEEEEKEKEKEKEKKNDNENLFTILESEENEEISKKYTIKNKEKSMSQLSSPSFRNQNVFPMNESPPSSPEVSREQIRREKKKKRLERRKKGNLPPLFDTREEIVYNPPSISDSNSLKLPPI